MIFHVHSEQHETMSVRANTPEEARKAYKRLYPDAIVTKIKLAAGQKKSKK